MEKSNASILSVTASTSLSHLRQKYAEEKLTVTVMPVTDFYDYLADDPDEPAICAILCSSKPLRESKLGRFTNYIFLDFDDVSDEKNPRAFDPYLADEIRDYLVDLGASDEPIIDLSVCCDYGESRSAAIASAILRSFDPEGKPDVKRFWDHPKHHPNPLVFRLTCEALGISIPPFELTRLVEINANALRKSICGNA